MEYATCKRCGRKDLEEEMEDGRCRVCRNPSDAIKEIDRREEATMRGSYHSDECARADGMACSCDLRENNATCECGGLGYGQHLTSCPVAREDARIKRERETANTMQAIKEAKEMERQRIDAIRAAIITVQDIESFYGNAGTRQTNKIETQARKASEHLSNLLTLMWRDNEEG